MAGYIGSRAAVATSGVERKKTFAITTTTTSLTGLDYTPNHVHVFHNGIRLVDGTDYTATNGTSITLVNAAENGDEVVVVSYGTFSPADTYTKTEADDRYVNASGDTMTGQLDTPYQVIKGDIDYIGMSIRNTKANYSTSFIDAQNRINAADSHIFFHHETDGSSTISFGTQPAGDFTDRRISGRMLINGNGHVLTPYQPAFNATALSSEVLGVGWQAISYNQEVSQRGSSYNTTTSTFTAPVSGWYQFNASWTANSNSDGDGTFAFGLNGSVAANFGTVSMSQTNENYSGHAVSACAYLAANDYVRVWRYSTVATTTRSYDWTGNFSGYLIG